MLKDSDSEKPWFTASESLRRKGKIEAAQFSSLQLRQTFDGFQKPLGFEWLQYPSGQRLKLAPVIFRDEGLGSQRMSVRYAKFIRDACAIAQKYFGSRTERFFPRIA